MHNHKHQYYKLLAQCAHMHIEYAHALAKEDLGDLLQLTSGTLEEAAERAPVGTALTGTPTTGKWREVEMRLQNCLDTKAWFTI